MIIPAQANTREGGYLSAGGNTCPELRAKEKRLQNKHSGSGIILIPFVFVVRSKE